MRSPVRVRLLVFVAAAAIAGALLPPALAQAPKASAKAAVVPAVGPAAMQKLLPSSAGWTRGAVTADKAIVSATCTYNFAYARYTNNGMTIRMTIADTGFDEGALAALATMVMIFPNDHVGQIPPATTVRRLLYKGSPAASLWDATTSEGEFTVVVGGRFVVKAEGTHLTDASVAQAMVDLVDLQALTGLK